MIDATRGHGAEDDPDASTIDRVLSGDVDAFALLVARHRDRCLRYAYRMLGDMEEAEDVTQDAFVRVYRSLARCQGRALFEAWLFRILVNRCRTATARKRTRLLQNEMYAIARPEEKVRGGELTGEVIEEIDRALTRLNEAQREAFFLKYMEEMTYEEMALLTGVSMSALRMRVSRACEVLREELAEVYNGR